MTASFTTSHRDADQHSGHTAAHHHADNCMGPSGPDRSGLLVSIQPRYAKAILDGQKKVELRRRPPKDHPPLAVIYGSGADRSVLGTARIEAIHTAPPAEIWQTFSAVAGVTREEFDAYFAGCVEASALELSSAARATYPLPLTELRALGLEPPQSWRYVNAEQVDALIGMMYPQRATDDPAAPRIRRLNWPWQRVKPLAAFGLRCLSIGVRQDVRPSDPISFGSLDHTLPAARCYSFPGARQAHIGEDL